MKSVIRQGDYKKYFRAARLDPAFRDATPANETTQELNERLSSWARALERGHAKVKKDAIAKKGGDLAHKTTPVTPSTTPD